MQTLQIDSTMPPWLAAAGCAQFEQLMSAPVGELVGKAERRAEMRRLRVTHEGVERTFYLKRSRNEKVGALLKCLQAPMLPAIGTTREVLLLKQLTAAGFDTMQPLAWGQERTFGWPTRGFMLCEAIEGVDLHLLRQQCDQDTRCWLQNHMGQLVGRLHAAGFFQPVRLKDLICRNTADQLATLREADQAPQLVLIDRATSKPWPCRFSLAKSKAILRRTQRRVARDGQATSARETEAVARGYCEAIAGRQPLALQDVQSWLAPTPPPAEGTPVQA